MGTKRVRKDPPCGDNVLRPLETFHVHTPIGQMVLKLCSSGLHMLYQMDDITDETFLPDRSVKVKVLGVHQSQMTNSHLQACLDWLNVYFEEVGSGSSGPSLPALCPLSSGTSFRDRVLIKLAESVPRGKTITYGELALIAGSRGAQQAVGTAMASNPFQLIVPCHRVVRSGNKVGKYSGGCRNTVKIWLLQHEGCIVNAHDIVLHSS